MTDTSANPVEPHVFPEDRGSDSASAIRVDSGGLNVEVRKVSLCSGAIHYWQHSPDLWPTLLEQIKGMGFTIVQTPVPWGVHEINAGFFDFGAKDPQKDLPRFLNLCRATGLSVILNLGPCAGEDLPNGGFPPRILKNSSLLALSSTGVPSLSSLTTPPVLIPSYASENFYSEVGVFFDSLVPAIKPQQSPKGPVILCSVNKETAFYGRRGGNDLDYSKDSITLYKKFLSEKYSSVESINARYGKNYFAFSEIQPPRTFTEIAQRDLPYYLDWMEYKEYLIRYALQRYTQMLRERQLTIPLAVDGPSDLTTPVDSYALQNIPEISLCGMEVNPARQEYASLAMSTRYLTGTRNLAWVSTFNSGASWTSPRILNPEEEEFAILTAIMHGMSAVNFHMLVESGRWIGAPIKRDGSYREEYADVFRRLNAFLLRSLVWESKKSARALVLIPFGLERYHRLINVMDQVFLGLLGVPPTFSKTEASQSSPSESARQSILEEKNWIAGIFRHLKQANVEFNISDTHASLDDLTPYSVVFLPTIDFLDSKEQETVLSYVNGGGHLVIGFGLQTQPPSLFPAPVLSDYTQGPGSQPHGKGKIIMLPVLDAITLKSILRPEIANPVIPDNPNVTLTIREGNPTLVFIANPSADLQDTTLKSPWPLRGMWNAPGNLLGNTIKTTLKPYSIQVWEAIK
jgi:beta-galactosidase